MKSKECLDENHSQCNNELCNCPHHNPRTGMSKPEPPPVANKSRPIWELVVEDMQERDRTGLERYGVRLQANNGRDALVDTYQEILDAAVYIRQEIEERFKIIFQIVGWLTNTGVQMPERGMSSLRSIQLSVMLADIRAAIQDLWSIKIERDALLRERNGEVWFWSTGNPEDGDNADTITCPILIQPETLRRLVNPIPMVLFCPACGAQHIDQPDPPDKYCHTMEDGECVSTDSRCMHHPEPEPIWTNPPHKSHLCSSCKAIWRPAEVPTVGVAWVEPGKSDTLRWKPL